MIACRLSFGLGIALASLVVTSCGGAGNIPVAQPGFTLSATPASPVGQGGIATSTITVTPQNGFSGSVALAATALPAGVSASFNPASTATTSVLTLTTASSAAIGSTTLTITGTSGSLAPTTALTLTVAAPNVAVTISPQMAAVAATTQTQQFTPTVTSNMGNSSVTWTVDTVAGGNTTVGTISSGGLYTPPATGGTHTITATSVALASVSASATIAVTDLPGVFTYHNDVARDGANMQEYALTPSIVNTSTFGKVFSCQVDGAVYTQPLWVPGVAISGGIHNILLVATQHDTVFAFDADANPCVTYWHVNLLDTLHGGTTGEGPVVWQDVGYCYGDVYPEVGVTGTPVIDPATGTLYLVSASEIGGSSSGNCHLPSGSYFHRLHALDVVTGSEKFNAPVTIAASVPGTGDGSSGGVLNFSSQLEHNRAGLTLAGGNVYVAFAAHEDATPYHGWLISYSASDVSQQTAVFNTTPEGLNGADGGIWGGGGAPAVDNGGDIYVATGNGDFDEIPPTPNYDYGDSLLRLRPSSVTTPNGTNLSVIDFFTPDNQSCLAVDDADLGSGASVLLPDQTSGPVLHLLVHIGKQGVVYLVNRDNMGQQQTNNCSGTNTQIVQSFKDSAGLWGTPAFWQNGIYYAGVSNVLKLFPFTATAGLFNKSPVLSTTVYNFPTPTPSISSQGANDGIVWAIDAALYGYASPNAAGVNCNVAPPPAACTGPAILHAYNATNLTELWNSSQAPNNRDQAGNAVKFAPPTIANGKVYVSTRTEVDVYGLLTN